MLVCPRDFDASSENPFANDRLGRAEHVRAVCSAIAEMDGPAVVALDGGWGTGRPDCPSEVSLETGPSRAPGRGRSLTV